MAQEKKTAHKKRSLKENIRSIFIHRFSVAGITVAILFLSMSLTPSLLPRSWYLQGLASGLALIIGYGLGTLIMWVWRYLDLRELKGQKLKITKGIALSTASVLFLTVLAQTGTWQNRVRELVGMEPASSTNPIRILTTALVVAYLILILARFIRVVNRILINRLHEYVPRKVATVVSVALVFWLFGSVLSGAFADQALRFANNVFSVADSGLKEGSVQPTSDLRSTGPESLVAWDDLGKEGKEFVGTGPTQQDISRFSENALEPIRVYAGLKNGETHEDRAAIVLNEMIRTNAFERSKVLIATSTGTGFIDQNASETFEYVHNGDTAIASMQYSYLPSWLALLSDTETAKDAGIALFNEIHNYWQQLDEDTRPELYLYGLSLGAYGSQSSISRVELLNDPVDGALWVGSPFVSEFWNRITDNRDAGSPAWQPTYQEGRVIRFTGAADDLNSYPSEWQDNKIIYLQNATDPVVFFSFDSAYRAPAWLDDPRGPGVTEDMDWYPFVTFWQLAFDFLGAGGIPEDFGHKYSKATHIDAWAALTNPEGWTPEKSATLKAEL